MSTVSLMLFFLNIIQIPINLVSVLITASTIGTGGFLYLYKTVQIRWDKHIIHYLFRHKIKIEYIIFFSIIMTLIVSRLRYVTYYVPIGWDTPVYIYRAELLKNTGFISYGDPYVSQKSLPSLPGFDIIIAALSIISGMSAFDLFRFIPFLGSILLATMWYSLSKQLFNSRIALISAFVSVTGFFDARLYLDLFQNQYALAIMLSWVILEFEDFRIERFKYNLLRFIIFTSILLFHLFTASVAFIISMTYGVIRILDVKTQLGTLKSKLSPRSRIINSTSTMLLMVVSTAFMYFLYKPAFVTAITEGITFNILKRGYIWSILEFVLNLGVFPVILSGIGLMDIIFRRRGIDFLFLVWISILLFLGSGTVFHFLPDRFYFLFPIPILVAGFFDALSGLSNFSTHAHVTILRVSVVLLLLSSTFHMLYVIPKRLNFQPYVSGNEYDAMMWFNSITDENDVVITTDKLHGWLVATNHVHVIKALYVDISQRELFTQPYDVYRDCSEVLTGKKDIDGCIKFIQKHNVSYIFLDKNGKVISFSDIQIPIDFDFLLNRNVFKKIYENSDVLIFSTKHLLEK